MPALLTSAVTRPSALSVSEKSLSTSSSLETSPATAIACLSKRKFLQEAFGRLCVLQIVDADRVAALGGEARSRGADAAAAAGDDHHLVHQRPRRKSLSRSARVSWYHVGRPWLQLPERSVSSISRSSAFISGERQRAVGAHRGMAGHRGEQLVLARGERLGSRRTRGSRAARRARGAAMSPAASAAGAARTASSFGPDTATSRPRRSSTVAVLLGRGDVERLGREHRGHEQRLPLHRAGVEVALQPLHDDALVRGVHVHEHEAGLVLRQDVDAVQLGERIAERRRLFAPRGSAAASAEPMNAWYAADGLRESEAMDCCRASEDRGRNACITDRRSGGARRERALERVAARTGAPRANRGSAPRSSPDERSRPPRADRARGRARRRAGARRAAARSTPRARRARAPGRARSGR